MLRRYRAAGEMTPELKRALLPLRLPRTLNLRAQRIMTAAWLPWRVFAAAVDGYLEAFFGLSGKSCGN